MKNSPRCHVVRAAGAGLAAALLLSAADSKAAIAPEGDPGAVLFYTDTMLNCAASAGSDTLPSCGHP